MNNQRMTFDTDRHTVTEGEVVEVKWQCDGADQVHLTLDNGYRSTEIPLPSSGSKRFRLNRSKGKTRLTITAVINGKSYNKRIFVRVKKLPTVHAETVDAQGRPLSKWKLWWQKRLTNWHNFCQRTKLALRALPERKQLAVKLMAIMGIMLLLCAVWPRLINLIPVIVIAYLSWVLLKR